MIVDRSLIQALIRERQTPGEPTTFDGLLAEGARFLVGADLSSCKFTGETIFDKAVFDGDVSFDEALFKGPVRFTGATFAQGASFSATRFGAAARFGGADFGRASFNEARFEDVAWFEGTTWRRRVSFQKASFAAVGWFASGSFEESADFSECHFADHATFDRSAFQKSASFARANFDGIANFVEVGFLGGANFNKIYSDREVRFNRSDIGSTIEFNGAEFTGAVWLEGLTARSEVRFEKAHFADQVYFSGASVEEGLWLTGARFSAANEIGPLDAGHILTLDDATFQQPLRLHARARHVPLVDCRLINGGELKLQSAEVVCDGATFSAPTAIVGTRQDDLNDRQTRLLSLRRVDVSQLSLVDVDLSACLFDGAHHVDTLRIEGVGLFASSLGARSLRRGVVSAAFPHRRTIRQCLAEEHSWRAQHARDTRRWNPPETRLPSWVAQHTGHPAVVVPPHRIAGIYRALRKANEDAKNQPGAADFYYGEMEMRRKSRATPVSERILLHGYWLASGYGLRASRALILLAAVLIIHGVLFATLGISTPAPESLDFGSWHGHLYAVDMLLFSPDPEAELTLAGHLLEVTLRVTGPILLGLAVLAVRGRVKR